MNEEYREQFLMHYGVKGMKWGVRRKRDIQKFEVKKVNAKGRKQAVDDDELLEILRQLRMQVEYDRLVSTLEANNSPMRKVENVAKNAATIATLTGSALLIYNNLNKAHDIVGTVRRKK